MANESTTDRPLAPASLPVLVGVVASTLIISFLIAERAGHDYLAVFAFVGTVGLASIILDRNGREEARRHPHPLYKVNALPTDGSPLRRVLQVLTLVITLAYVVATATPDTFGSPMPYFAAVVALYMLIPQVVARRAVAINARPSPRRQ